jgi:WD40 repeat protein/serine/threonine protein kinase
MARISCPDEVHLLPAALGQPVPGEVQAHLEDCLDCRRRLERLRAEVGALRETPTTVSCPGPPHSEAFTPPQDDAGASRACFLAPPTRTGLGGAGRHPFSLGLRGLGVHPRCPHCRNPVEPTGETVCPSCGSPLRSEAETTLSTAPPAELVDHPDYQILRQLPQGGMGVVYLAHNRLMARDEVLKLIGPDIIDRPGVLDRFLREIRAVARLRHPNIVTAYSAFRAGGSMVFAMEYVEGLDLKRIVKAKGPLPVKHACHFAHQAALGLQHAHEAGMVHRDIKPSNLMLTHQKRRPLLKILDFGLAKAGSENPVLDFRQADAGREPETAVGLTCTGQMLGTPDFIAPEQIADARAADIRADIYSLGCTLYYLLSARPPFEAATLADVLRAHCSRDPRLLNLVRPEVPAELAVLVAQMMAKEPSRRFQAPMDVAEALAPFFAKQTADAHQPPSSEISLAVASAADRASAEPTPCVADTVATPSSAAMAGAEDHRYRPESIWPSLIKIDETEEDRDAVSTPAERTGGRPQRLLAALASLAGLAAVLLGAVLILATGKNGSESGIGQPKGPIPRVAEGTRAGGESSGRRDVLGGRTENQGGDFERSEPVQSVAPRTDRASEAKSIRREPAGDDSRAASRVPSPEATPQPVVASSPKRVIQIREDEPSTKGNAPRERPSGPIGSTKSMQGQATARYVNLVQGELPRTQNLITSVAFLPDGRHAVTVGQSPDMVLWDLVERRVIRRFQDHPDVVFPVAVSPDGLLAATGGQDKISEKDFDIRVWELATGGLRRLSGHKGIVSGLRFTPGAKHLILISTSYDGTLRFWNVPTWGLDYTRPYLEPLTTLATSADGRLIATGTPTGKLLLWDVATRQLVDPLKERSHHSLVHSLAFLPDNNGLISTFKNGDVVLWDIDSARPRRIIRGHTGGTIMVACSPDGLLAATGGEVDGFVRLWDMATGREVNKFGGFLERIIGLAFSADGRLLLAADKHGALRLLPIPTDWQGARILPNRSGRNARVTIAVVSPDGRKILSASIEGRLTLWDRESGRPIPHKGGSAGRVTSVAFSPDGRHALTAGQDKILRLRDLESGRLIREFIGHRDQVSSVAFSPDGRFAYSASGGPDTQRNGSDFAIRVWNVEAAKEERRLEGHNGPVFGLAVSPDGRRILTRGDTTMILWDAVAGREICRWEGQRGLCGNVAFLPDGRRAVSCGKDKTVRLWDLESGQEIGCFRGHRAEVSWLAVSPDGRRILSSGSDGGELQLWDVDSRKVIQRLVWGSGSPTRGSITPDGHFAVWGGSDGTVRVYRLADP